MSERNDGSPMHFAELCQENSDLRAQLEKAQGELEAADETISRLNSGKELQSLMRLNNSLVAERASARALLADVGSYIRSPVLRARIAKELGQ